MITIATVLRSGGDYRPEHVRALADMCGRFAPAHRFVVLTDQCYAFAEDEEIEARPLKRDWPGWWAKMELFALPGPVLFFDLDTVIVRSLLVPALSYDIGRAIWWPSKLAKGKQ